MDTNTWHRVSNVRPDDRLGDCSICGPNISVGLVVDKRKSGPTWPCLTVRRARRGAHGLNYAERQELIANSGGQCEICGTTEPGKRGWMVDHCHETGAVRGVLCSPCNVGIGMLGDDPSRVYAAADYLTKFVSPNRQKTRYKASFADYRPNTL